MMSFFHKYFGISGPNYPLYAYRQTCSSSSSLFTSFSSLLVGISCLLLFQLIPPPVCRTRWLYMKSISPSLHLPCIPHFFPQSVDKHVITMLHKYANFEIHTSFYPGILSLYSLVLSVAITCLSPYLVPNAVRWSLLFTRLIKRKYEKRLIPSATRPLTVCDRTWLWSCVQTARHHCHHQFIIIIIIIRANVVWINTRGGKRN